MITNKKHAGREIGTGGVKSMTSGNGYAQVTRHATTQEKIQLYDEHPTKVISLHGFHSVALNRLQALRKIEFM